MNDTPLIAALAILGLVGTDKPGKLRRIPVPQPSPRNTKTSMNMALQSQVWEAAKAKRERRQSRNLANAGRPQGELL